MRFGKQGPEGFPASSGRPPLERKLLQRGVLRPRIQLPDFPPPLPPEAPPLEEDDILLPDESDTDNDPTDPKLIPGSSAAQVKIPR